MEQILPNLRAEAISRILREAEHFEQIETACLDGVVQRCREARVVILGESTHGTSEFYQMRSKITSELIHRCGFNVVAIEAGWGDAEAFDQTVRHLPRGPLQVNVLGRFGSWMWKNREFYSLIEDLKRYNLGRPSQNRVGIYGLDIYGMDVSLEAVLDYLQRHKPELAQVIQELYSGMIPWKDRLSQYASDVAQKIRKPFSEELAAALKKALEEQIGAAEPYFHLIRNMRLISAAEEYIRAVFEKENPYAWNMRDTYMFETLEEVLSFKGAESKAIIWAHNSHTGNPNASALGKQGYLNLAQLCTERYGELTYRIGFGFYSGTFSAAPYWNGPQQIFNAGDCHSGSYEALFHETGSFGFFLPLRPRRLHAARQLLLTPQFERGIGLCYDAAKDSKQDFYQACLPEQFDEFVWFDRATALSPLSDGVSFPTHSGII